MNKLFKIAGFSAVLLLAACSSDDDSNKGSEALVSNEVKAICEQTGLVFSAVVSTKSPTYDGSDVELIHVGNGECVTYTSLLPKVESDYVVDAYQDSFYHLGRKGLDSISKYKLVAPQTNLYMGSAAGGEGYALPVNSNVYGLEFISEQSAFMYFYALDKLWQVNPGAQTEGDFKVSENAVDLSAYNGNDAAPEVMSVENIDGKLFVIMQRLDTTPVYPDPWIKEGSYVAVFDQNDLSQEVDTGEGSDGFKGIELPAQNPISASYHPVAGLFLAAVSDYHGDSKAKNGGIVKINPATYKAELLIADEELDNAPYFIDAAFSNVAIVDENNGFLVAYNGWKNNDLYHFNPQTGEPTAIDDIKGLHIAALAVDPLENVWVSINSAADPHVKVLSKTGEVIGRFSLNQGADNIVFAIK